MGMATTRTRTPIVPTALLAVVLTACGGGPDEPAGRGEAPAPPSPSAASPEAVCVRLITYWAHDQLEAGGGSQSDYQQKGLSDGQNTILLDVVARARKEAHASGAAAARKLVESEVRKRCAERYDEGNTGAPSAGWPQ